LENSIKIYCSAILIILSFWTNGQTKIEKNVLKNKLDIEVTTFRHLFKNNASLIKNKASYYFISIEDSANNTIDKVIDKLDNVTPTVKKIDEYHTMTEEQRKKIEFLSFYINEITFLTKRKVEVYCGYYEASLSSSGNVVRLVKIFGKWRIIKDQMIVIS